MSAKYEPWHVGLDADLSETTLEECAPKLGPSFVYELHVNHALAPLARRLVKTMGADTRHHPYAPHINLVIDHTYENQEWSIHANGKAFGSRGVG